jgi:hypothetical protein
MNMRANYFSERSIPLLFLAVTVAAYGLLLPLTGFYWDDWPFAWIAKFLGPWEFIPAFSKVRPFLGPIFFVTTSLIPPVPLYWQIFALVIRFLACVSTWFVLRQVWPRHKWQALVTSLLFLVFPGYSQHWVAYTHINQEWIPFIFYLLSFGFTARALRTLPPPSEKTDESRVTNESPATGKHEGARNNTIFALLLLIAGVFPTEYFVSIEPMRFLFIWVILSERTGSFGQKFIETFKRWIPYFLIWLANGAWLAYFYTIGGYESYDVEVVNQPLTLLSLLFTIGDAIWKAGLYVWAQVLVLAAGAITAPTTLATLGLIVLSFLVLLVYLKNINLTEGPARTFAISAIVIGLAGILLGRIPSFAAGLPLTLQSSYDRFMISMMLGGSLLIAGLVELFIRPPRIRTYAFALLIALGIGQQFFNANIFRRDWAKQQEIYWQLAWRIPAMKPDTALLTDQLPIDYETDLGFTAPINWMYAPEYQGGDLPYALFYTEKRLGGAALPSLEPGTKITLPIRRVNFNSTTSQVLVIHMPRNGCLRVLDPTRRDEITYSRQSRYLVESIRLSDLSNILINSDPPAQIPFLSEPEHTWCYYFAKAELAYQQADWERVIVLIDEAQSLGFAPEDPFEWLTYIEALARTGDYEAAEKISVKILEQENRIRKGLCEVWKRVQSEARLRGEVDSRLDELLSSLSCTR